MSNEHINLNEAPPPNPDAAELESPLNQPPGADVVAQDADNTAAVEPADVATEMNAVSLQPAIELNEAKRGLEAALLAASEPMPLQELKKIFDGELSADILRNLLDEIKAEWADRSVELSIVASGYRFRVKPDYQKYIDRLANEKPLKYSRAVLETMAIIAYRQPVTRSDIEDIRGVAVSPHILKTLEDRGWIDEIGHKDAPGRPALFATTKHFLDDLNLLSLDALPPLHELQATLDMSQAGAALHAGSASDTLALPGVASNDSDSDLGLDSNSDIAEADQANAETARDNENINFSDDKTVTATENNNNNGRNAGEINHDARHLDHNNEKTDEKSIHDSAGVEPEHPSPDPGAPS